MALELILYGHNDGFQQNDRTSVVADDAHSHNTPDTCRAFTGRFFPNEPGKPVTRRGGGGVDVGRGRLRRPRPAASLEEFQHHPE